MTLPSLADAMHLARSKRASAAEIAKDAIVSLARHREFNSFIDIAQDAAAQPVRTRRTPRLRLFAERQHRRRRDADDLRLAGLCRCTPGLGGTRGSRLR